MPRAKGTVADLFGKGKLTVKIIKGDEFIRVRDAAKLAGIHPAIVEMGHKLLADVGKAGGAFELGDASLKARAADIEAAFVVGLRRIAKVFAKEPLSVKSARGDDRLSFWYQPSWARKAQKGAS